MDVLQLIKEEHAEIINHIDRIIGEKAAISAAGDVKQLTSLITQHFDLESNYLYLECEGYADKSFFETSLGNQRYIVKLTGKIADCLETYPTMLPTEELNKLRNLLSTHFLLEEEVLLPTMRKRMSTEVREELADVFLDIRESFSPFVAQAAIG